MLTVLAIKNAAPKERAYKISDAGGLYLLINPTGSKLWRFDYRFEGRRKTLAFGAFPEVPLAKARDLKDAARASIKDGVDPSAGKRRAQGDNASDQDTFGRIADAWFDANRAKWGDRHARRVMDRLKADVLPFLSDRPIREIEPPELLKVVRRVEERGALHIAGRIKNHCGEIFRFGIAEGRCMRDPSADIRSALKAKPKERHRKSLSAAQLPDFFSKLIKYDGCKITALAIRFTILTMVRTNEVRFARWAEFENLAGKEPLWRIPAERMKQGLEHVVPLSPQAASVLEEIRNISRSEYYVFEAPTRSGVMSENTMLFALYRMGYHSRATIHGFRTTASTILNENEFNPDWIERQLSHVNENAVRSAYNAAQWLTQRRRMMCWWADFVDFQESLSLIG